MYRKLRNYTNHEGKNLKPKYFCQMIEDAKGDSCEMWRAIEQVLPGTNKLTVSSIFRKWEVAHRKSLCRRQDHELVLCVSGKVLAKPFQNFSTVFTSSTPPFEFHPDNVHVNFVCNVLKSLKSNEAVGLDKLRARLLKVASDVIAPNLTGFINKSFTDRVFTGVWKSAKVTVLF